MSIITQGFGGTPTVSGWGSSPLLLIGSMFFKFKNKMTGLFNVYEFCNKSETL